MIQDQAGNVYEKSILWRLHPVTQGAGWAQSGIYHASNRTSSIVVNGQDAQTKLVTIVLVVLGIGCVNIASQIMFWKEVRRI